MSLQTGTHLGPYEILSLLGAGGMGEVYRAKDTRLDREVAIKVLPEKLADNPDALARFEREAKAIAALSHPNILAIFDVGNEEGVSFVVTELLEGETLRQHLRGSAVPWRKALDYGAAIADGLAAAHAKGVIHRDLKPANIFITSDGVVKILDFGLARMEAAVGGLPAEVQADTPTKTLDTKPGTVLGTLNYMSPEQVRGKKTDARSDIFALGCVLHEMVTGQRAFSGETSADTMTAILKEEPVSVIDSSSDAGPELDRVIMRCLEKKAELRIQSARDLGFALRDMLSNSGVSKAYPAAAAPRLRMPLWITAVCLAVLTGVVLRVALNVGGWRARLFKPTDIGRIDSLAVLPLENLSGDPEQDYFADGMTEALISDLAKIGALRVISRTSAMRYKGTDKSLPEIGRELNVEGVVEGSVLHAGDRVRITVQLIHAQTDTHLWSEHYERDLHDILALQSEVAKAIAQEIQIKLTPQEEARLTTAPRVNAEAHQLYLKGRYYWNKRTAEGFNKAIEHFQRAIDKDPAYALGYAGLADTYALLGSSPYDALLPQEAMPKAKAAAMKALAIDDTLAEARTALAYANLVYDWDCLAAEEGLKRAIELNPGDATAHQWYGNCFWAMGRLDEALAEIQRAQALDPLSLVVETALGWHFHYARQPDQAIEQFQKTIEAEPNFALAHLALGMVYAQKGMHEHAIAEIQETIPVARSSPIYLATLGHAHALSGHKAEARTVLSNLEQLSSRRYVPGLYIAAIYAALQEEDQAFRWLEKAFEQRAGYLVYLKVDPAFDSLRDDPRFDDLLRRIGLEP